MLGAIFAWHEGFFPKRSGSVTDKQELESDLDLNDVDCLIAIAAVYFNLTEDQFLDFTPLNFDKLLVVKREAREQEYRTQMNIMRQAVLPLINIQLETKDKYKTLNSFMPFPWEKNEKENTEIIEMTEEDWEMLDKNLPANIKHK